VFARNMVGISDGSSVVNVTTDEEGALLYKFIYIHTYVHKLSF